MDKIYVKYCILKCFPSRMRYEVFNIGWSCQGFRFTIQRAVRDLGFISSNNNFDRHPLRERFSDTPIRYLRGGSPLLQVIEGIVNMIHCRKHKIYYG